MSLECKKKIYIPIQESQPMLDRYILVEVCCIKHEAMSCDCLWGKLKTDFRAFARVSLKDQHLSSSTWNSNLLKIDFHLYQSRNKSKSMAQYHFQTTIEKKQQSVKTETITTRKTTHPSTTYTWNRLNHLHESAKTHLTSCIKCR